MKPEVNSPSLFRFFNKWLLVAYKDLGKHDHSLIFYLSNMLTRFARTDNLYRIKSYKGKALYTAVEMLLEAEVLTHPDSEHFDPFEEREIRKHVGDYTLFMTGIFREHVEHLGVMDFYQIEGKLCYQSVYELDQIAEREEYAIFAKLSYEFEKTSGALDYMKKVYFRPEMHLGEDIDLASRLSIW
jgi:hypothetical protein